ncbi:hypothetical protein DFH28DRAFT_895103 [Melampsora americana]|nr:hypothetical protein DFH28DRAFT_895103 [Melampsora americana]
MDSPLETVHDSSEDIRTAVVNLEPPPAIHISDYRISSVYLNFRPMTYLDANATRTIYDLNRLRISLENGNDVEEKSSRSEPKDVKHEKEKVEVPGDDWTCDYKWLVTLMGSSFLIDSLV